MGWQDKKKQAMAKLDAMYKDEKKARSESPRAAPPPKEPVKHEYTTLYDCSNCEETFDTAEEARDCCGEKANPIYSCNDCEEWYTTVEEAEGCSCTVEEEPVEEPASTSHTYSTSYRCSECENDYDDMKEAKACCKAKVDTWYQCDDCEEYYETIKEAENCSCDVEGSVDSTSGYGAYRTSSNSMIGVGIQIMMGFIFIIFMITMGGQILSVVQATGPGTSISTANETATTLMAQIPTISWIAGGVLLIGGLAVIFWRRRS